MYTDLKQENHEIYIVYSTKEVLEEIIFGKCAILILILNILSFLILVTSLFSQIEIIMKFLK